MALNLDVQAAIARWNAEVDRETARLIEDGTPPYDAAEQARGLVERRRREAARRRRVFEFAAGAP